jgi:hypothetical protein
MSFGLGLLLFFGYDAVVNDVGVGAVCLVYKVYWFDRALQRGGGWRRRRRGGGEKVEAKRRRGAFVTSVGKRWQCTEQSHSVRVTRLEFSIPLSPALALMHRARCGVTHLVLLQRRNLVEVCGGELRIVSEGGRGEAGREMGGTVL